MQIDNGSKMIYVHIPRTGGSWFTYSWRAVTNKVPKYIWSKVDILMDTKNHNTVQIGRHGRLSGIKDQLEVLGVDISKFKIVTLVREPIDIISSWRWFSKVKDTAKKHGWTSIDDMLDEYESGHRRANYLPQTYWLSEQDTKFDHIFRFEDLLKGPGEIQKIFPLYQPKGKLRRGTDDIKLTGKQTKRIKELYKEDVKYLSGYYDY